MTRFTATLRCLAALSTALVLGNYPALAQFPVPECDPASAPANAAIDGSLLTWCSGGAHPGAMCDLAITEWDAVSERSPDLRIGDPFNAGGPTPAEEPRFFFDSGVLADPTDDRFYTKLYVKFHNIGGGAGAPAPATEVSVDFSYKLTSNPADRLVPGGWLEAGTVIASPTVENTYQMNIPLAVSPVGALFPGLTHSQQRGVCWSFPAGDTTVPLQFILRAKLNWTGEDGNPNNDTAYGFYDFTSFEPKAQIGFAIDLSGSMDDSFFGGTKLQEAIDKAMLFTSLVEDGNQLGVYGFATRNPGNTNFDADYIDTLNAPQNNVTLTETSEIAPIQNIAGDFQRGVIAGQISGQSAHGCTPIGQGLLRAREAFDDIMPPPGASKAIVLFSDGLQNVKPFVEGAHDPECWPGTATTISTLKTFKDDNIEIYVVFFGDEAMWAYNVMYDIQDDTGGKYVYGTDSDVELANAYFAIRGRIDDMLFFEDKGTVSAAQPSGFTVPFDGGVRIATVAVNWPYDDGKTRLELFRRLSGANDWVPCQVDEPEIFGGTTAGPAVSGATSFEVCRFMPGADTTWEFEVRQDKPRTGSSIYSAAAFSAVQSAQITGSLNSSGFETGKPLPISAELRSAGVPLAGATVNAVVQAPASPASTMLRGYAGKFADPADPLGDAAVAASYAKQLKQFLRADTGSDEIYVYRDIAVALRDDGQGDDAVAGDGIYSGVLPASETHVAGDYRVTISAEATLASGRTVQRVTRLSAVCNVGSADPGKSIIASSVNPDPSGNLWSAQITVSPTDQFGNAAFPGSGSQIRITPGAGVVSIDGDLIDNRDTTFTQRVTVNSPQGAKVKVSVRQIDLGTHVVGGGGGVIKRELSLHVGVANPHGTFASFASAGPSIGVDFTHRVNSNFAVRAELVRDEFDLSGGGSVDVLNLSAYLQYRTRYGQWCPYFETGVGFYDFDNAGSAAGFGTGLGAQRELTPKWNIDFNLQGHRVGGNLDLSFSRARIGAIYKF